MDAIEPIRVQTLFHRSRWARSALLLLTLLSILCLSVVLPAEPAHAGRSATGELAFHPCTQCHPVSLGADGTPTSPLPIDLARHEVELEVHDILGEGDRACLACHDDPARNPGMLVLADGSLVDITGDVSRVCQRCHFEKYREWEVGIHGKDAPKCSAAGCHDPHTPSWIYMPALPPFQGTGVEIKAVADREPFKPLAPPPLDPPVRAPVWLPIVTGLGVLFGLAIVGYLLLGKAKR